jgi:hypothetical protein
MNIKFNNDVDSPTSHKSSELTAVLFLLQENLSRILDEVDRSYELLKIGEKTEFSKRIESKINNPVGDLVEISSNIDLKLKGIVNKSVKDFLKSKTDIVKEAYRTKTPFNDLHYSIILKKDNIENRAAIFEFLDKYDLFEISSKYPVYFQFVPIGLKNKMFFSEQVVFA